MDKSWMRADRRSNEYRSGVEAFIEFTLVNARDPYHICCPCTKCENDKDFSAQVIKTHLLLNGINLDYDIWDEHGEAVVNSESDSDRYSNEIDEDSETDSSGSSIFGGHMEAKCDVQSDSDGEEYLSDEYTGFRQFVDNGNKPLYPGCTTHTRMAVIVKLYNIKTKHIMSESAYSDVLAAFAEFLPTGNSIPDTLSEANKVLTALGMDYTKIDACPNDCILYRKDYEEETKCPRCTKSRWKLDSNDKEREGVPAKTLWYFPIIPRFKRMFQSPETSKSLTWHATTRKKDGFLRHPADSTSWKFVDEKWPAFGDEPRNLRLALSSDGFNPHSVQSNSYSCWPVILVTYNLPPWLVMKRKHMMLSLLISGPKQPRNYIDVYLEPLIDDLKLLWAGVSGVYDAVKNEIFTLRAVLFWTINDFPAYGNLSGTIVKGYNGCPICLDQTEPTRLKNGRKMSHNNNRRFLEKYHPYRKLKAAFNNCTEDRTAPVPLTGEELLSRLEQEVPKLSLGKKDKTTKYKGAKREQQQKRRKKNKYSHRMSCKGYIGVEEEVIEELGEEGVGLVPGEGEIDRDITCAEVRKEVDEGKRTAVGMNDILTQALETPEHSGRVRGVGGHITPHEYFGLPNLRKQSFEARMRKIVHEESKKIIEEAKLVILKEAKEQLREEIREEIEAEEAKRWEAKFAEFTENLLAGHFGAGIKNGTPLSSQGSSHTMEEGVSVPNLEAENTRQKSLFQKKENELPLPPKEKVPAVLVNEAVKSVLNKITRNFAAAQSRKKKKLESVDAPEEKKDYESVHSVEYPEKNKASKSVNVPEKKKWTYMVGDPEIDCKLVVGSVDNIVAHATIMETGDDPEAVIHGRPLGDDNRHVSVYYAIDEKAKVPFPVENEIVTVKHAMGSWVAWPKDLIILPNEVKV
ncbi:hypothetical protein ACLB2K_041588 [Fragaria x ananassa]